MGGGEQWAGGGKKKLADAARHWVRSGDGATKSDEERVHDELQMFGVPDEEIAAGTHEEPAPPFLVWRENAESLLLFLDLDTQWRLGSVHGCSVKVGLDYTAVEAVMRIRRTKKRREVFDDLMVMERAALKAMSGEDDGGS